MKNAFSVAMLIGLITAASLSKDLITSILYPPPACLIGNVSSSGE